MVQVHAELALKYMDYIFYDFYMVTVYGFYII